MRHLLTRSCEKSRRLVREANGGVWAAKGDALLHSISILLAKLDDKSFDQGCLVKSNGTRIAIANDGDTCVENSLLEELLYCRLSRA